MHERGDEGNAVLDQVLGIETPDESPGTPASGARRPSAQSMRRRETLSLYLEQLEEARRAGGDLREAFDGIELDSWELDQLGHGLDGTASWQALIAEGVAFRNKFQTDLGWIPSGREMSAEDATDLRRLLITNTAVGIALLAEIQLAVNQLVLSGGMEDAKRLTGFRNKIGQSLNNLRDRVGANGYAEAEELSEGLVTPAEQASWTERDGPAPFAAERAPSRSPAGRPVIFKSAETRSHIKPLLMLLGLTVVVWGVFIMPKFSGKTLPELTMQDVAPRAEIRHVVARPPSLYVKLDTQKWRALSKEERLSLVEDVGRTATAAGYHGARFTLENGRTAAQWLKERGSQLID